MISDVFLSPLRMLFLANYAPLIDPEAVSDEGEGGKYSRYHEQMFKILQGLGFKVTPSREIKTLIHDASSYDYVFSLLNRAPFRGSEILVSSLCEYFGLRYLGARPHVRAVAEDKYLSKLIAQKLGFNVPAGQVYRSTDPAIDSPRFNGPYIAKPRCGASSRHITENCIQDLWSDLLPEVHRIIKTGDDVLVEEWIPGINVCLPILGDVPPLMLPAYELRSVKKGQLITYEQKRGSDKGLRRFPYENSLVYKEITRNAMTLYRELQPLDYLRLDFRVTDSNQIYFLEFNVCCNIGPESGFYNCAKQLGMSHSEMLTRILRHSFKRQEINGQSF